MERTLVIIKPDGIQRQLIGEIISRFEKKGLKLIGLKMTWLDLAQTKKLYAIHEKKPFYKELINFITSTPVVLMVLEANNVVAICRKLIGATFGPDAEPGTIRGDFGAGLTYNLVHASDSVETARNEISLFFKESELFNYKWHPESWLYSA